MKKHLLIIGIIFLFLISAVTPIAFGFNRITDIENIVEDFNFDRHLYPEYYDSYSVDEIPENIRPYISNDEETSQDILNSDLINPVKTIQSFDGPMDSPWPMYCHDTRHTGRSPFSTADNMGYEKWQFDLIENVKGAPVIDDDGVIYIGASHLFAIYPNGTLKWEYAEWIETVSAPAIDENGVLYVGSIWAHPNYLYAIYTSNGTLKWKFKVDNHIFSSPAIGDDGSIYFGSEDDYIYALYPNGTLKWKYLTSVAVLSSPAIGDDGTIYCGSHDNHLYALYPNNGTIKWKYGTGNWIRTSPCIADDGTIYVVSLDNYLHAVYPNGTLKWKTNVGAGTSPTIGQDGTIYCGYSKLHAVDPIDGSVKWTFDVQGKIRGATPCNSIDGTIYLGNSDGSDIVAVNPDGTEKWRVSIGGDVESAPCIDEDGTVYIGDGYDGYLHAFGPPDPNAPDTPTINGPINGKVGTSHEFTFTTIDPNDDDVFYYITWGDGTSDGWLGPHSSGEIVKVSHTWSKEGTYVIKAQAKDTNDLKSDWGTLTVTMPRDKAYSNVLSLRFLERYPQLNRFLTLLVI